MNNLPKVVMQLCPEQKFNPRPVDRKSNALPAVPQSVKCKQIFPTIFHKISLQKEIVGKGSYLESSPGLVISS